MARVADGNNSGKTYPAVRRPINHAGGNGAGLRNQRKISRIRHVRGETCVEGHAGPAIGLSQIKNLNAEIRSIRRVYGTMPPQFVRCQEMGSSITPPVVYVVDDDTGVLGSLRFLLETDGFVVRTFRSGAGLLSAIATGEADCFVIDYKIPAMSGIELASRLRNRDTDAPIILITGYPDENILEKAAAAGIRHVLQKPHLEENLASRIRGAIQESHLVNR